MYFGISNPYGYLNCTRQCIPVPWRDCCQCEAVAVVSACSRQPQMTTFCWDWQTALKRTTAPPPTLAWRQRTVRFGAALQTTFVSNNRSIGIQWQPPQKNNHLITEFHWILKHQQDWAQQRFMIVCYINPLFHTNIHIQKAAEMQLQCRNSRTFQRS